MEKIKLLVLDEDPEYAYALGKAIALNGREFLVECGQSSGYFAEGKDYDLILLGRSEEENSFLKEREAQGKLVRLTEVGDNCADDSRCFPRFGSISRLISMLRTLHSETTGKVWATGDCGGMIPLVGFLSAKGGTGKTIAALTYSRILSTERNWRVLFLSFESFSETDFYMEPPERMGKPGDFLYYLFSGRGGEDTVRPDAFLFRDTCGVYAFDSSEGPNELALLTAEELSLFFTALRRSGMFDRIVMDLPLFFSEAGEFLIESCGKVVLVGDGRFHSAYWNEKLRRWLETEAGFDEESLFSLETEWDEENVKGWECGIKVSIYRQAGREALALVQKTEG